ncbi:hypothetical protein KQI77_12470 [Clostridium sp. MSJ-8]|nr:hypothetical protein [Clostridium sp. MSJ-8]MBU5488941.1 hypothetical protein [Clostridium sp. MSJ-8]MBU5488942.1 hypothetical protein [Clostridium sp. MSJ-8]
MEKDEKIIDELFEELTEETQLASDASCGGGICSACHCNFTTPWSSYGW